MQQLSSNEILVTSLPLVDYELTHHLLLNVKHTETGKFLSLKEVQMYKVSVIH